MASQMKMAFAVKITAKNPSNQNSTVLPVKGFCPELVMPEFIIVPSIIMALIVLLPLLVLYRFKPIAREVMMVLFTILFVSAIVFTLTGFLFRGPGFELYLPWDMPGDYSPWDNL